MLEAAPDPADAAPQEAGGGVLEARFLAVFLSAVGISLASGAVGELP